MLAPSQCAERLRTTSTRDNKTSLGRRLLAAPLPFRTMAWAPVHEACVNNDPEALLRELESGASPYLGAGSYDTRSPLCLVLEHARDPAATAACVRVLLNRAGTSIVVSGGDDQMAPLHYAAEHAFTEVVAVFLEAGVEVDSTWRGRTALQYAAGRTEQYGARGLAKNRISSALAKRHEAATRFLLEAGASVNGADEGSHLTPLHFAAAAGMYEVCRLLLAAGASVDLVGRNQNFGDTPLAYAYRWTLWHGTSTSHKRGVMRSVPHLLRAGAALPSMPVRLPRPEWASDAQWLSRPEAAPYDCPYIRKVRAAGGFRGYEKQHLAKLVALLAPKLAHRVPTDVVPRIVSFWYPAGFW